MTNFSKEEIIEKIEAIQWNNDRFEDGSITTINAY